MDIDKRRELVEQSKKGSLGALCDIIKLMREESQEKYNKTNGHYRPLQSRLRVLDEIIELLPETSE